MAHANLSPSSAARWINCPGSIRLCRKAQRRATSVHAQEGTAAHTLGERCLREYSNPYTLRGETITNDDGSKFIVDNDMAEAVQVYIDFVNKLAPLGDVSEGHVVRGIEKKVEAHDEVWGTADLMLYVLKTKHLVIADYKHGKGVLVNADNAQTKCYALGALLKLKAKGVGVDLVTMYIVQPRSQSEDKIRSHDMTATELLTWQQEVLLPGIAATKPKDAPLCAGEHCRWCDALPTCPQQAKEAMALAKVEFGDENPALPDPSDLTPDQLVKVMHLSEVLATWAKSVQGYAQERAEMGLPLPGYKLVAKRSVRQWTDEDVAAATLEMSLGEDAYNKKLLSPAQAEKALKAAGFEKGGLNDLIHKPDTGLMLVAESDRRHAVVPADLGQLMDTMDIFQ